MQWHAVDDPVEFPICAVGAAYVPIRAAPCNRRDSLARDELCIRRQGIDHPVEEDLNPASPRVIEVNLVSIAFLELSASSRHDVLRWRLRDPAYHLKIKKCRIILPDFGVIRAKIRIRDTRAKGAQEKLQHVL